MPDLPLRDMGINFRLIAEEYLGSMDNEGGVMQTVERKSRREVDASRSTSRAAYVRSFTGRNMKFDINGDILFRMLSKGKSTHNMPITSGH